MTETTRYPLSWPFGWKRTPAADRQRPTFSESTMVHHQQSGRWQDGRWVAGEVKSVKGTKQVSMRTACERLQDQIDRLGGVDVILSTNVELTIYSEPKGGRRDPTDPGAAVYFKLHGKPRVLACDLWNTVAGNIAAIAQHIDALRRVDRYGVGTLEQAFAGYDALPPPGADNRPPWRKVFGFPEGVRIIEAEVRKRYLEKARDLHPDKGGTTEGMAQLNLARDEALREASASEGAA